jgi:FAD/FMN-containing dehydrogenase
VRHKNKTGSVTAENTVLKALEEAVGSENVTTDQAILATYAFDSSIQPACMPGFVVKPKSVAYVQEVLKVANEYLVPVTPLAAGVNVAGTCIPSPGGIVLDMRWMDKIVAINTDAAYAVVEPGVTFDQLTGALSKVGFRTHIPTAPGGASVLANSLQTHAADAVSCRETDPVLAVEVILPNGEIVRTGSAAYPTARPSSGWYRAYAPYPDLTHLFCCAYGTLGVVTKAAIKILPINEDRRLVLGAFPSFEASVDFVRDVVRGGLAEHCIIWNRHFYKSYDIALEADGRVKVDPELLKDPRVSEDLPYNIVTVHMSGYREDMETHEKVCASLAKKYGGRLVSWKEMDEKCPGAVRAWKEFYLEYHQPKMEHNRKYGLGRYIPWIVVGEARDVIEVEKVAVDRLCKLGARPVCYYVKPEDYARSFSFRMFSFFDPDDKEIQQQVTELYADMFEWASQKYGVSRTRHRRYRTSDLYKLGGYATLLKKIKDVIDPNDIMNPGVRVYVK